MPDGTNTPRQLFDLSGDITLSARYTPWGDTLDTYGTGDFTFGYFGGVMDAATGLLYVGNGQYYDPATGRFLTRDAKPNNSNPYVPWDPTGAIIGPLAAMALFFARKRKRGKWDILVTVLLLSATVGMGLVACGPAPTGTPPPGSANTEPPLPASTQTPVPIGPGTSPSNTSSTATPPIILTFPDCPTAIFTIPTPIGTPTPTPVDAELAQYGVYFIGNMAEWTNARVAAVRDAVIAVAERMAQVAGGGRSRIEVFRLVFEGVNFSWGTEGASGTCETILDGALSRINDALGGNLNSMLGVHSTLFYKFPNAGDELYYGITHGVEKINFFIDSAFPYHVVYHEMGHLLNNAQGQKYTNSLEHAAVYTGYPNQEGERVMGTDCPATETCQYNRIDGQGYINPYDVQDPSVSSVNAELHPASEDGNNAGEEWGDLFANYVAENFNSLPEGRAKYNWVYDQLFSG